MIILPYFSRISSFFGRRNAPIKGASSFHKGMDIAAPAGTPVYAAADGVVTVRESQRGYGNVVYLKHPDGSETRYGHLSAFAEIPVGTKVQAGTPIGFVGSTGMSTGNHLHFEVRDATGQAIDPRLMFGSQLDGQSDMAGLVNLNAAQMANGQEAAAENNLNYQHPLAATKAESDDIIAFEYKKRVSKPAPKTAENYSFFNWSNTGVLGALFHFVSSKHLWPDNNTIEAENEYETDAEFLSRPSVQLRLSKADMNKNGFTDQEISKIARFVQFKQQSGLQDALSQNGQVVTPEELALIGIQTDKIELFNRLADIKMNEQNNQSNGI